jgi:competence protein ComGC
MKKTFLIGLIVLLVFTILVTLLLLLKDDSLKSNTPVDSNNSINYYENLREQCNTTDYSDCCISSVEIMESEGYLLEEQEGCPEGYQTNMLRCLGTLSWCEPI